MNLVDLGKTKAFFTVEVDNFEIEGMKLVEGKNGLFAAFPSRSYKAKDGTTKYIDIVKTASKATYHEIVEAAKAEYGRRDQGVKTTSKSADLSLDDDETDELPF